MNRRKTLCIISCVCHLLHVLAGFGLATYIIEGIRELEGSGIAGVVLFPLLAIIAGAFVLYGIVALISLILNFMYLFFEKTIFPRLSFFTTVLLSVINFFSVIATLFEFDLFKFLLLFILLLLSVAALVCNIHLLKAQKNA